MIAVSSFVTTTTDIRLIPKAVDNVLNGNVLTMRLLKNNSRSWAGRGTKISIPVYLNPVTTLGSYSGFDTFNTTQENKRERAEFDPSQVFASVQLSGIQKAINSAGGDAAALDLVAEELSFTAKYLSDEMGNELYGDGTGNSSKDILGLIAAIDDTTSVTTYGGISRATHTNWRGTRTAQSGSLTLADLAADYDAAQRGSDAPTIMITTPAVFSIYEALLTPTVSHQFSMNDFRLVGTAEGGSEVVKIGGTVAANQGFRALTFRGIPFVADEKCTAANIFTLNESHLYFYVIPQVGREVKSGFGWTGFKEPVNQDAVAGQLLWYGQFVTDAPRTHARRTGVTS